MNLRPVLLVGIALAAAGGTAFVAKGWLSQQREAVTQVAVEQPKRPVVEILVASQEMAIGTFIKPENITWQAWPEETVSEGYYVKGKATPKDFEGAIVRAHLYPGEPITATRVLHPGDRGFLAAVVEPGKRAVSVPVDATRGVSGFVFPGDYVDVLLTYRTNVTVEDDDQKTNENRVFAETLLSKVRVLGIDQNTDNTGGTARVAKTATLEVLPKQAERIATALELGQLSLSLNSVAHEEADLGAIRERQASNGHRADDQGYTPDTEVLFMMGDPMGTPLPSGMGPKITIMRGTESKIVRLQ